MFRAKAQPRGFENKLPSVHIKHIQLQSFFRQEDEMDEQQLTNELDWRRDPEKPLKLGLICTDCK